MHLGMSDLSVFRFEKRTRTGWTTAGGMYVGHFIAWIAACLLYAVFIQTPEAQAFVSNGEAPPVAPGPLAYDVTGVHGIIAALLARWATAPIEEGIIILPNWLQKRQIRNDFFIPNLSST